MRRTTIRTRRLIRSMINGSIGPMLRPATALDWVGDPFDTDRLCRAPRREHLRAVPRALPGIHRRRRRSLSEPRRHDASDRRLLLTGEAKYRRWIVEYMDAWLERMKQNGGIIPSFVDSRRHRSAGRGNRWWDNAYGWGFSPINPVTGRREDRNRIPRALVGFSNALLVTGDQKYVDAWRAMIDRRQLSRARHRGPHGVSDDAGADGWYGWQAEPWNVGALEVWYWSMRPADRARVGANPWLDFLDGTNAGYPETALRARHRQHPGQARDHPRGSDAAGQAAGRQHARLQPRGDRRAGAADAGRARAGPRGRSPQRPPALLRSRTPARRRAGGRGGARLGTRRSADRRHARQPEPDRIAHA